MQRGRRKVKSGCRTCKLRKVKCDEGWPACRACVSTGRVCDGYGIWGGGGNRYEQRSAAIRSFDTKQSQQAVELNIHADLLLPSVPLSNAEEYQHFQFFKEQTLSRLPGVYSTKYNHLWESLVVQGCVQEPAVMHAVLAISSAHRRKLLDGASRNTVLVLPDKQEEFLLQHYCKSIRYLQPRFGIRGTKSIQTILITCLVFVYLELLRGTYKRAYDHLEGGVKLLSFLHEDTNKTFSRPGPSSTATSSLSSNQGRVNAFLIEAFARLRIQLEFSKLRSGTGTLLAPELLRVLPTLGFTSFSEARHYLDRVLDAINLLAQAIRDGACETWPDSYWNMILTERRFMQGSLDLWLRSYAATMAVRASTTNNDDLNGYKMLRIYHTMAEIMGATCLSQNQSAFDQYNSAFLSIVSQCHNIASNGEPSTHALSGSCRPDPRRYAWPDISWIPPLYFTAIKCRDHQIRTQALELMSSFWRYEIVWDLGILDISSIVAKEVIRMEEGDHFKASCLDHLGKVVTDGHQNSGVGRLLPLPEEQRFNTVEMFILDDTSRNIRIVCKSQCKGGTKVIQKVFDQTESTWTKVETHIIS